MGGGGGGGGQGGSGGCTSLFFARKVEETQIQNLASASEVPSPEILKGQDHGSRGADAQ